MKYTINGKEYSEFEIKVKCAKLMGVDVEVKGKPPFEYLDKEQDEEYDPLNNPADAWPIIEKIRNDLMDTTTEFNDVNIPRWEYLAEEHKCSMLTAACICFIEMDGTGRSS